jgi:hypothetical protein
MPFCVLWAYLKDDDNDMAIAKPKCETFPPFEKESTTRASHARVWTPHAHRRLAPSEMAPRPQTAIPSPKPAVGKKPQQAHLLAGTEWAGACGCAWSCLSRGVCNPFSHRHKQAGTDDQLSYQYSYTQVH